jgi:hypothetical protein
MSLRDVYFPSSLASNNSGGDQIQILADILGIPKPTPIYPDCQIDQIKYIIKWWRLHHQHMLLADGTYLVQHAYKYRVVRINILYVRQDQIEDLLDSTGFWEGQPNVQPMIPGTNFGYYQISGQYIESYESVT